VWALVVLPRLVSAVRVGVVAILISATLVLLAVAVVSALRRLVYLAVRVVVAVEAQVLAVPVCQIKVTTAALLVLMTVLAVAVGPELSE
jgi:hypothetical protein